MAVYRIVGPLGEAGLVYYGSTEDVRLRWPRHKSRYQTDNRCSSVKRVFDEYGVDACRMEIVEEVKEDLIERERWWIENHECVNERIPGRTDAEYHQANQDEINGRHRERYQANREKILAKQAEYYQANKDKIDRKRRERRAAQKV